MYPPGPVPGGGPVVVPRVLPGAVVDDVGVVDCARAEPDTNRTLAIAPTTRVTMPTTAAIPFLSL